MELPHWRFIWISRQIPPSADLHKHPQSKRLHRFATSDSLSFWPVFVVFVPSLCALCMPLLCCDDWLTGSWLLWLFCFFSDRKHNWPNNVFWLLTKIQLNPAKRGEIDECSKCSPSKSAPLKPTPPPSPCLGFSCSWGTMVVKGLVSV